MKKQVFLFFLATLFSTLFMAAPATANPKPNSFESCKKAIIVIRFNFPCPDGSLGKGTLTIDPVSRDYGLVLESSCTGTISMSGKFSTMRPVNGGLVDVNFEATSPDEQAAIAGFMNSNLYLFFLAEVSYWVNGGK